MKRFNYLRIFITVPALLLIVLANCGQTQQKNAEKSVEAKSLVLVAEKNPDAVSNALPYTVEFIRQESNKFSSLPAVQSYVSTISKDGYLLVIGGRTQGLHQFNEAPAHNFPEELSNDSIFVIDPKSGEYWAFDTNKLNSGLSAPLQSTNQQAYHDRQTDLMYILGGYGWKADKTNMITFPTIISFQVEQLVTAIRNNGTPASIESLMKVNQDERFAVTGGELFKMGSNFYLVFGQKFDGQYRAFGGDDFQQEYTEQVRIFNINSSTLKILNYGATTNKESDKPFHRRDGNIIEDIDPATGKFRITAFGGVFQDGKIAPYTYPIYIYDPSTPTLDRSANQKFSQYTCPVVTVYDSAQNQKAVYHTFFGGIGHYYYFQTPQQKAAYDTVTFSAKTGKRNDGFPYVTDISTFLQTADGTYKEFIHTSPIQDTLLMGTNMRFNILPEVITQGLAYKNGVFNLASFPASEKQLVGYVYGGIQADFPLPLIPNQGSHASNALFAVYLSRTPSDAIPADKGHSSSTYLTNRPR